MEPQEESQRKFRRLFVNFAPVAIAALFLTVTAVLLPASSQKPADENGTPAAAGRSPFMEGPRVFQAYCADCHGKDGKGGGPVAGALKKRPPDLTRIKQRNGGVFPFERIQRIISGNGPWVPAHGSREMPVWGPIFDELSWDGAPGSVRIYNLTRYIQSLQQK